MKLAVTVATSRQWLSSLVWQRIGRIREKSRGAGAHYDIDVIVDDSGAKARAVTWERRPLGHAALPLPSCTGADFRFCRRFSSWAPAEAR